MSSILFSGFQKRHPFQKTRNALQVELGLAALRETKRTLPNDVVNLILEFTLIASFLDLSNEEFSDNVLVIRNYATERDIRMALRPSIMLPTPLRRRQLNHIVSVWQKDYAVNEVIMSELYFCSWVEIDFPVGWKGSGDYLSFDVWLIDLMEDNGESACAVFVFLRETTDLQLEYYADMAHGYQNNVALTGERIRKKASHFMNLVCTMFPWS